MNLQLILPANVRHITADLERFAPSRLQSRLLRLTADRSDHRECTLTNEHKRLLKDVAKSITPSRLLQSLVR